MKTEQHTHTQRKWIGPRAKSNTIKFFFFSFRQNNERTEEKRKEKQQHNQQQQQKSIQIPYDTSRRSIKMMINANTHMNETKHSNLIIVRLDRIVSQIPTVHR